MSQIELRPATALDCVAVWRWNNRPEVRAVSFGTHAIPFSEHCRWFGRQLRDPDTRLAIVVVDDRPSGVIRIQPVSDGIMRRRWLVSIALDPSVRGAGVGRRALRQACALHAAEHPGGSILAWIHDDNHASARCFDAAGFHQVDEAEHHGRSWRIYEWSETSDDRATRAVDVRLRAHLHGSE